MAENNKIIAAEEAIANYIKDVEDEFSKTDNSYLGIFSETFHYYDPCEAAKAYQSLLNSDMADTPLKKNIVLYALLTSVESELNIAVAKAMDNSVADEQKNLTQVQQTLKFQIETELKQQGKDFNELSKNVINPIHYYAEKGLLADSPKYTDVKKSLLELAQNNTFKLNP